MQLIYGFVNKKNQNQRKIKVTKYFFIVILNTFNNK